MVPEWAKRYQKPGTTIKHIGKNYYLYYATSYYDPKTKKPVSKQTHIGKITEHGVASERVSIDISKTEARQLKDLIPDIPSSLGEVIVVKVKNEWRYTKTESNTIEALKKEGVYANGTVIF